MQHPRLAFALILSLFAACTDEPGTGSAGDDRPGIGPSTARPQGKAFSLPEGIELVDTPRGYSYLEDADCDSYPEVEFLGAGNIVNLCILLRNTTGAPIDVVLPPGLIFISESTETQNGLLIETVTITVPADGVVDVVVSSFCANADRDAPAPVDTFEIGPITEDPKLVELIELLDGVDVPSGIPADEELVQFMYLVQQAVWEVTDGEGLRDATRADLEAFIAG